MGVNYEIVGKALLTSEGVELANRILENKGLWFLEEDINGTLWVEELSDFNSELFCYVFPSEPPSLEGRVWTFYLGTGKEGPDDFLRKVLPRMLAAPCAVLTLSDVEYEPEVDVVFPRSQKNSSITVSVKSR